jgi:hypothetical protein
VKRAFQLFETAARLLRADEIADPEEEALKNELQRRESVGLGRLAEKITMRKAFLVQQEIATQRKHQPFKTERGFIKAMHDAKLVDIVEAYGETDEEWIKSPKSGERPIVETRELTSRKAIEALFEKRAKDRKARDHARHQKSKNAVKEKNSENLLRAKSTKKRSKSAPKRKVRAKSDRLGEKPNPPGKT